MSSELEFMPLKIENDLRLEVSDSGCRIRVTGWRNGEKTLPDGATHFGMMTQGAAVLQAGDRAFRLTEGMFFVLPGIGGVEGRHESAGLVISMCDYRGLAQIGGPLENTGRLRYIDGCTDTLLVSPPVRGEPCLNHLHIPSKTNQTSHTHPSSRLGVILRGSGECRTPHGNYPLEAGMAWYIPTGLLHSFHTIDESLDVIAWHPDSDFGPTHDHHPMVSRTFVDGISASKIPFIQTRGASKDDIQS